MTDLWQFLRRSMQPRVQTWTQHATELLLVGLRSFSQFWKVCLHEFALRFLDYPTATFHTPELLLRSELKLESAQKLGPFCHRGRKSHTWTSGRGRLRGERRTCIVLMPATGMIQDAFQANNSIMHCLSDSKMHWNLLPVFNLDYFPFVIINYKIINIF
jgi:hypothetical protein